MESWRRLSEVSLYPDVILGIIMGADINAQGGNAMQAASASGHETVVRLLLENGADVNAQGGRFRNALQAAEARGHETVVRLLLEKGVEANTQDGFVAVEVEVLCASYNI